MTDDDDETPAPAPAPAERFRTEPTPEGLQYIIPGCEKDQDDKDDRQGRLF